MAERVSFLTDDGVKIVGDYYAGKPGGPAALLLHMMPATRSSWRKFADHLTAAGFSQVLAIDLRGHGESTERNGETLDYKDFSDREHQASIRDVEAAVNWFITRKNVSMPRLILAGASIGANLAIAYAAGHDAIPAVVALSPGLDYRGVTIADKLAASTRSALFLAASDEDEYSRAAIARAAELRPDAVVKNLSGAGHGTAMFEREPRLIDETVDWLKRFIK